jgi:cell division protease FtsH
MTDIAYAKTKQILLTNKDKLTLLAEKLLEKEVIFKEDLEEIFGKRPYDKHEDLSTAKIPPPPPMIG